MLRKPVSCRVFVGRHEELATLEDARRGLSRSAGSFVVISGEAGIGKTRLLKKFLAQANSGRSKNVALAECLARVQQPFGAIRSWARSLLPALGDRELPPNAVRALAQLVPDVIPNQDGAPLDKAELFVGIMAFLKAVCAKHSTILSVEDIHWADRSTLDFLEYVAPKLSRLRLLLVATYRSDELEKNADLFETLGRLLRAESSRSVQVQAMSRSELRVFVKGALEGQSALPIDTIEDVEVRSEGNPFFAEELLKSALEHRESSNQQLPISIRASILQRLSALDEDGRRAISFGAALGYRFDPELLAAVLQRDIDEVMPALCSARDLNILVDEPADRRHCRFRHALTRQTIYENQGFGARNLHSRILATLESLHDPQRHIQELAYHSWESGDTKKAFEYNERAGEAAFGVRGFAEAAVCYKRALKCAATDGDRARILERIGIVAQMQGSLEQAIDAFESALAIRLEREEHDHAAAVTGHIATERNNLGDVTAGDYAARFVERHGDRLSATARDNLLVIAGRFACIRDRFDEAHRLLSAVSNPRALPPRIRQGYLIAQATRHSYFGDVTAWKNDAAEFEDILPSLSPYLRLLALYAIAQTGTWIGANRTVERALEHAARLEAEWEFAGPAIYGAAVRASYHYLRGQLAEALVFAERVLERPDIRVAKVILAPIGLRLAAALHDLNLERRCADEQMLRAAREMPHESDSIILLAAHATTLVTNGGISRAQADLRLALAGTAFPTSIYTIVFVAAAMHLPEEDFVAILRVIDRTPQNRDNVAGRAAEQLVRAIVARRSGELDAAASYAANAAELYESLEWPLFKAQALELAAGGEQVQVPDRREESRGNRLFHRALSAREREIAQLTCDGLTNAEMAERLALSTKTIEKHLSAIFTKLSVRSRTQLAALAAREYSGEFTKV